MNKRRIQVFISSTFTDMSDERKAAVEAILKAGHIPAGMELFTSGNQSPMEVIESWINDSDVYMLILGGRYGSIEPQTGKSYTQLEYEYAVSIGKPFFALLITPEALEEKVRKSGTDMMEKKEVKLLELFREQVKSKMVESYGDTKDIKNSITIKLLEYERDEKIIGWTRGNDIVANVNEKDLLLLQSYLNDNEWSSISFKQAKENIHIKFTEEYLMQLVEEYPEQIRRCKVKGNISGVKLLLDKSQEYIEKIKKLENENSVLKKQIAQQKEEKYNGLTYEEIVQIMKITMIENESLYKIFNEYKEGFAREEGFHSYPLSSKIVTFAQELIAMELAYPIDRIPLDIRFTESGKKFYLRMKIKEINNV